MGFLSRLFGGGGSGDAPVQVDYSDRSDGELLALAQTRGDLTDVAQRALDEELSRRGLGAGGVQVTEVEEDAAEDSALEQARSALRLVDLDDPALEEAATRLEAAMVLLYVQQDYAKVISECEALLATPGVGEVPALCGVAHQLIGRTFTNRERWADARAPLEAALLCFERVEGDAGAGDFLQTTGELAQALGRLGLNEEAERRLREGVAYGRQHAPGEPLLAHLLEELAGLVRKRGLASEADALDAEAEGIQAAL